MYPMQKTPVGDTGPVHRVGLLCRALSIRVSLPITFGKVKVGRVISDLKVLSPILRRLHLMGKKVLRSAMHVLRVKSDRVQKRVCPRAAKRQLTRAFNDISCASVKMGKTAYLAFARPSHVTTVTTLGPRLLVLSFKAGRDRGGQCGTGLRCRRVSRLVSLVHSDLPSIPVLLAAPPNSCRDFQQQNEHQACAVGPHAIATTGAVRGCTHSRRLII